MLRLTYQATPRNKFSVYFERTNKTRSHDMVSQVDPETAATRWTSPPPCLAHEFALPDVAYLAPQAAGHTWYPYSFLSRIEQNEPGLSSALLVIDGLVQHLQDQGLPANRVVVMGFSQGACLTMEFAARHARRYAAIAGFSGGLIGPPDTARDYPASFEGTPVFIGCSDVDHTFRWSACASRPRCSGA